jgi:hypothetical protein
MKTLVCVICISVGVQLLGGCTSVYHDLAGEFRLAPSEHLLRRVTEARESQAHLLQQLRADHVLLNGVDPRSPDTRRLQEPYELTESCAWDLAKRIASIRDVAAEIGVATETGVGSAGARAYPELDALLAALDRSQAALAAAVYDMADGEEGTGEDPGRVYVARLVGSPGDLDGDLLAAAEALSRSLRETDAFIAGSSPN